MFVLSNMVCDGDEFRHLDTCMLIAHVCYDELGDKARLL